MRTRLKRIVTCSGALPAAGLVALHEPVAAAEYSPPGAFIGGLVSMVDGGVGSVTYTQAVLAGGVALLIGPFGHGADAWMAARWKVPNCPLIKGVSGPYE